MYLAVRVGKFVKQVVSEWCPSQCCAVPFAFTITYVINIIGGDTAAPVSRRYHLSTITPFMW